MSDLEQVQTVLRQIAPLLASKPPQVQGAVLADLLATWLAGHVDLDKRGRTKALRQEMLGMHIDMVRKLVPENAKAMGLPW
jgi:hypothetical protein